MTRLAVGGKWGKPVGAPPDVAVRAGEEKRLSFSSEPSAAAPRPTAVRPKNWRRVWSKLLSISGFIVVDSRLGNRLIEIEDQTCHGAVGSQFAALEAGVGRALAHLEQVPRRIGMVAIVLEMSAQAISQDL